jgi:hypothetical protein
MRRVEWPHVYDLPRLEANETPVQAVMYYDDLYVDIGLQQATLAKVGNAQYWVTNEFEHDGLHTGKVFGHLHRLLSERGGALT